MLTGGGGGGGGQRRQAPEATSDNNTEEDKKTAAPVAVVVVAAAASRIRLHPIIITPAAPTRSGKKKWGRLLLLKKNCPSSFTINPSTCNRTTINYASTCLNRTPFRQQAPPTSNAFAYMDQLVASAPPSARSTTATTRTERSHRVVMSPAPPSASQPMSLKMKSWPMFRAATPTLCLLWA